ncbi:MAG: C25 family cysteine peptidase [Bacteroidales bacterium]|jgi:hypothetical protein|nr:C25 family cysteine peptidase [Bacteroidales bacterium]
MKKHLSIFIAIVFCTTTLWAQTWVGLTDTVPAEPEITLINSTNQQVSFTVELSGFYATSTTEKGITYQRLSIPGCGVAGEVGTPEMPIITQRIAIPKCSGVNYSVQITASQTLQGYRVYPVPEHETDSSGRLSEVFAINELAYQTNAFTPVESYAVLESGALRNQHFVQLELHPLKFNPVTGQLQVATQMSITLSFVNPTTSVNVNTGIFNNVATNTFLNYQDQGIKASINDRAFEKAGFTHGSVDWIRINNPSDVENIVADYLIICADAFFPEDAPNEEILRIAHHRATYNGFDVMILNVEDILNEKVGFYYEPQSANPAVKNARRIRTCIRMIYEGQNAQHTYDGHLGYVLLVGDVDADNTGMPSSSATEGTDYYFSCITKNEYGIYDNVGDLYVGRFCVPNNILPNDGLQKLYNMVEKTIFFESEASFGGWRNNVLSGNGDPPPWALYYNWLQNEYMPSIIHTQNLKVVNYYDGYQQQPVEVFRQDVLDLFNFGGSYLGFHTHGYPDAWNMGLTTDYILPRLNNTHKTPLCVSTACWVGKIEEDCLAERLTHTFPDKGFVAMVGSAILVIQPPQEYGKYYDIADLFPNAIYQNLSHIVGEAYLESKLKVSSTNGFHIFGDPALNIMADGFEVTHDITVDSLTDISSRVRVRNGATLTFTANAVVNFHTYGQLIIEHDGALQIENHAQFNGNFAGNEPLIHIKGGEFIVGEDVVFQDLHGGILLENYKGKEENIIYDDNKQYYLEHITFNNSPLMHQGTRLHVENCTFNPGSNVKSDIGTCRIYYCNFINTVILANHSLVSTISENVNEKPLNIGQIVVGGSQFIGTNNNTALKLISTNEHEIHGNTISGYETGISLTNSGNTTHLTNNTFVGNDISNCYTGFELFNSRSIIARNNIHNNVHGVKLFNNSYTVFGWGQSEPHIIQNCDSIELYASENSFPTYFRYNKISDVNNQGYSKDIPLFWWDVDYPNPDKRDVTYNCWGNNFVPQYHLYPSVLEWDPVWDCSSISGSPKQGDDEDLYFAALDYFANDEYANAEATFKELIQTYPHSRFAIAALHELFALEHYTNRDFYSLNSYYITFTPTDSNLFNTADFLATRCMVKERDWQPAVDWYENRIENPPSYQDSVFAVIDLGDIHLMMEADTLSGGKSGHYCHYRLPNIKPKNRTHYEENKSSLLATLPQIKKPKTETPQTDYRSSHTAKGALGECVPNPTSGDATISYEIFTGGVVEIQFFNSMGQLVKSLPQGNLSKGDYRATISVVEMPVGVYHYTLVVIGERVDSKKMVVN